MYNFVFGISVGLIVLFLVVIFVLDVEIVKIILNGIKNDIINNFDGFFMWLVNLFVLFCLVLIVLLYGNICFGGKEVCLIYFCILWFVMLFVVGMGIGLMFWGVVEFVVYFIGWYEILFGVEVNILEVVKLVMGVIMFYWGLYFWVIYVVVLFLLVFFCYNKGLLLLICFIFYFILGDKVWGWLGYFIDIFVVFVILFGFVMFFGLGV